MEYTWLDQVPLWVLFLFTIAVVGVSIEVGYQLGKFRRSRSDQEKDAPVGAMVAATLGLLAFMLAFTFGLAAARFEARRMLVLNESNAIGTAYLRALLLPQPQSGEIRQLFREYIDVRIEAAQSGNAEPAVRRSAELHSALWSKSAQVVASDYRPIITSLFVQALNNVIDIHAERVMFALHNRIPTLVWLVLTFIAVMAMTALGYQEGLSGSRRSLAVVALALTFSAVMLLSADLDRSQEGLLRVSQRAMVDLRNSLDSYDASAAGVTF